MKRHLSDQDIRLFRARKLAPSELLLASDHIAECEACRSRMATPEELQALERDFRGLLRPDDPSRHLHYQEFADYVDGKLSATDAAAVRSHLQECQECSEEISAMQGLKDELRLRETITPVTSSTPRRKHSFSKFMLALVASFVVLIAGLFVWRYLSENAPENLLAAAYTEARPFEFRLADKGYGPIRQPRAAGVSALDRPKALLEAQARIKEDLRDGHEVAGLLLLRGRVELLEQEYDEAVESLRRAQELNPADARILGDLGCAYALRGEANQRPIDYGNAIDLLKRSLLAKPGQVEVLFNLALVYERMSLNDEAIETWKQYLAIEKDSGWSGEAQRHLEKLEAKKKAREHASEQVKPNPGAFLALVSSDPGGLNAELFQDIAWSVWLPQISADPIANAAFHELAQIFASRFRDKSLLDAWKSAKAKEDRLPLNMLAEAMQENSAGKYDPAFDSASAASAALLKSGNRAASLRARIEIAISRQRTSPAECFAVATPLVKDLEGTSYSWMQGQALMEQGLCHKWAGELELADQDLLKASQILDDARLSTLELRAQGFLGSLSRQTGNYTAVWEITGKGLRKCWELAAPPARAQQFDFDLQETCRGLELNQAAAIFGKASVREISLTGVRPIEAGARVNTASLLKAAGDFSGADSELAKAATILNSLPTSPTNTRLLIDTRLTRAEMDSFQLAATRAELKDLDIALANGSWEQRLRLKQALGRSLAAAGDDEGATRSFQEAISAQRQDLMSVSDPLARITRTELAAPSYKGLMSIQLEKKHDQRRALAIWDSYRESWRKERGAASVSLVSQQVARHPNAVRLIYVALPEGLAAFSVQSGLVTGKILKASSQDVQLVQQRFLRSCSQPQSDVTTVQNDARQLYRWLIEPFLPQIANAQMLLIDADSWLASIPFAALLDKDGHYLVEHFAIAMSSSPTSSQRPDGITSQDRALIVSVPSPGGHIPALVFAKEEARLVAAQLPGARLLSDSGASLDAVRSAIPNTSYVHFVGHGWSNAGDGGLILASGGATAEPAYVTAGALSRLDWSSCSLVVLSACMTGTGEARGPFNSGSLVRAFLASGARRVVAARWNLDEAATATLMKDFYASVVNSKTPTESLAIAERAVLRIPAYAHPYYWASFSSFGEQ